MPVSAANCKYARPTHGSSGLLRPMAVNQPATIFISSSTLHQHHPYTFIVTVLFSCVILLSSVTFVSTNVPSSPATVASFISSSSSSSSSSSFLPQHPATAAAAAAAAVTSTASFAASASPSTSSSSFTRRSAAPQSALNSEDAWSATLPRDLTTAINIQANNLATAGSSNSTINSAAAAAQHEKQAMRYSVASFDFGHVATPYIISLWIIIVGLAKIGELIFTLLDSSISSACETCCTFSTSFPLLLLLLSFFLPPAFSVNCHRCNRYLSSSPLPVPLFLLARASLPPLTCNPSPASLHIFTSHSSFIRQMQMLTLSLSLSCCRAREPFECLYSLTRSILSPEACLMFVHSLSLHVTHLLFNYTNKLCLVLLVTMSLLLNCLSLSLSLSLYTRSYFHFGDKLKTTKLTDHLTLYCACQIASHLQAVCDVCHSFNKVQNWLTYQLLNHCTCPRNISCSTFIRIFLSLSHSSLCYHFLSLLLLLLLLLLATPLLLSSLTLTVIFYSISHPDSV